MPAHPDRVTPLIAGAELREALRSLDAGGAGPAVLDVRSGPGGESGYLAGHIPAAVYVDLAADLSGPGRPGAHEGRNPLPAPDALQNAMQGWGISTGQPVVIYDEASGLSAARAWWLLRWAGHSPVRVLDGASPPGSPRAAR